MTAARTIGICGRTIPRIGMGTLYILDQRGFGPARTGAVDLLKRAAELGVRFFDTADSYGNGAAEEAVRAALHPYEGLLIATKGGYRHDRLHQWVADGRPERLQKCLDESLKRLGVETIDLYQLHCPDRRVDYADQIGVLAAAQADGKIRHIGISNVGLRELEIARREVDVASVQNAFNIRRGGTNEVLEACERNGIVFIPWMPLGDGGISWTDSRLTEIARKHGGTAPQVALAALLHRSDAILPIPGTGNPNHLAENVAAAGLELDEDDLVRLWR